MIKLFIDTSTSKLIVGLYNDDNELYLTNIDALSDLSSKVLPEIKKALDSSNIALKDVNEIYVVNGPGSFTGLRVGITIAKTMACALNIKIYTVSELELLATSSNNKYIASLIDARRGYVYAGLYNKDLKNIIEDQYIKLDDFKELLKKYKDSDIDYISYDKIDGAKKPDLNIIKLFKKSSFKSVNAHEVKPNYLKKTEAEEKLNDKKN